MEGLVRDIAEYCYGELREPDPAEVDLQRVVAEVRRQLSNEFEKTGAVLTHDPLPTVMGDFLRLALLLRGLVENACKFRGTEAPRIHIGVKRQGSDWVFSVRDNGLGFNPVYAERVFKPFERLNGKRYPGSGLGLTLARRIAEQHGGRIGAESQLGQGSTFWFTLPAAD
jgi:chemotaxis family two-component system sensor kinase Cph1